MSTGARTYAATVTLWGRRFALVLVSYLYARCGVAVFHEVTPDDGADGEPRHNIYEDVGDWCIDGGRDQDGEAGPEATPTVLKINVMTGLELENERAVLNALLALLQPQTGADAVEAWR